MAGGKSLNWHPSIDDFILVAKRLDKLGFVYHKDRVILVEDYYD